MPKLKNVTVKVDTTTSVSGPRSFQIPPPIDQNSLMRESVLFFVLRKRRIRSDRTSLSSRCSSRVWTPSTTTTCLWNSRWIRRYTMKAPKSTISIFPNLLQVCFLSFFLSFHFLLSSVNFTSWYCLPEVSFHELYFRLRNKSSFPPS